MIRLLRTEKQHSPGPGTTRGQGTGSLKGYFPPHQFSCLRQEEAQGPVVPCKALPRNTIPRSREATEPPGE